MPLLSNALTVTNIAQGAAHALSSLVQEAGGRGKRSIVRYCTHVLKDYNVTSVKHISEWLRLDESYVRKQVHTVSTSDEWKCEIPLFNDKYALGVTRNKISYLESTLYLSAQLQVAGGAEGRLETVAVLRPGAAFGAGGFLCSARQPWEVRARTLLRVLTLGAGDRRELERAFPHARRRPAHPRPMARHRLAHRRVRRRPRICTSFAATCSARSSS